MFDETRFSKLWNTEGIEFFKMAHFLPDRRLSSPIAICSSYEAGYRFSEYETYPEELCHIFYNNGG